MNSKALVIRPALELPEKWAKRWQLSGHFPACKSCGRRENRTLCPSGRTSRTLWIFLCLLGLPAIARAQTNQSSWENLSTLQAGQKIQVAGMKSKTVSGTFESFSDAVISLQTQTGQQTIQRMDVRSVKLMENHHRVRNALIGGAVGAGAGAGIGAATYKSCSPSSTFCIQPVGKGAQAGIGALAGLAVGAAIGALWPSHKTIYRSTNP
jgi:hypothetical protein